MQFTILPQGGSKFINEATNKSKGLILFQNKLNYKHFFEQVKFQ